MVEEKVTKYSLEYLGVKCTGVSWKDNGVNVFFFTKDGKDYRFLQVEKVHCNSDTDHIRLVIEYLFLPWLRIERIKELESENAELKARLEKSVELENKINNGELVDAIWFKSWINGQICCGSVIGYSDGCFVIACGDDLITAEKIYTSREKERYESELKGVQ